MDRSIKSMKINIETISSKRIEYADIMKALCIIAVIAGHADFANSMIKPWIYSFHMPCFFIVSGMLYSNKKNERVSTFLSKKFRQLMVPYFLWGMMYSSFGFGNLARIVYGSHQSLIQAGSLSSLWFLPAMFLALFGMKVVHKWAKCNSAIEAILGIAIMLIGGGYSTYKYWISLVY